MNQKPLEPNATIFDAIQSIESSVRRMTVVVDYSGKLLGTLTDGDIRRHILSGGSIQDLASRAMHTNPIIAEENLTEKSVLELMQMKNVIAIPTIDEDGKYRNILHISDVLDSIENQNQSQENFLTAVIMAGGEGRRLRPLTESIPKPMLTIGNIPLLEHQIRSLSASGVKNIYISINYLANIITEYFGDGEKYHVHIKYLKEEIELGTAGALSLLPKVPDESILVLNGDVFTTFKVESLYSYHKELNSDLTIGAVNYQMEVPYGVLEFSAERFISIHEKPSYKFLCNAGIYAISSKVIERVPKSRRYEMTDLISSCTSKQMKVHIFPIYENWTDIGNIDDLERARRKFIDSQEFNLTHREESQ